MKLPQKFYDQANSIKICFQIKECKNCVLFHKDLCVRENFEISELFFDRNSKSILKSLKIYEIQKKLNES